MAEIVIVETPDEAGELVAGHIVGLVKSQPSMVLGVATGSTPLPVYQALHRHAQAGTDFTQMRAFALDEYVGIPVDHPESYHSVIHREVTVPLGLDPANVHVPDGNPEEIQTAGVRYEEAINAAGGVEVQLLGIGTTGHLGFNEPGSSFGSRTRIKSLTHQTRMDNARFFDSIDDVPVHCITQGLGTIMRARHLVLLAFGEGKAQAIAAAVEGPMSASMPGSMIQLHRHVTVVVDRAAASQLVHRDYYEWSFNSKPDWQGL